MAEKNITIEGYDVASFLAQQAVEKLFKSIFALENKKIPRIHYLDDLARKLGLSEDLMDDILDLTADYTFSRYPDVAGQVPYEEYDEDIAQEKVDKARQIFERLRGRCKKLEEYEKEKDRKEEEEDDDE